MSYGTMEEIKKTIRLKGYYDSSLIMKEYVLWVLENINLTREEQNEIIEIAKEPVLETEVEEDEEFYERYFLVPIKEYGSEGLIPLYEECNCSCMSSSGGSACGGFMGHFTKGERMYTRCADYLRDDFLKNEIENYPK